MLVERSTAGPLRLTWPSEVSDDLMPSSFGTTSVQKGCSKFLNIVRLFQLPTTRSSDGPAATAGEPDRSTPARARQIQKFFIVISFLGLGRYAA
ncbi:MAG: hypothetical protein MUD16_17065 [Desulfobacterales bacterium]|nr:hypothetical protein [Desulfobacterales bacterium]